MSGNLHHHHHHSDEECRELLAQINEYLDDELPEELRRELEAHLAGCEDCRVAVDTLNRTVHIYRALDDVPLELPDAVEARLMQRLLEKTGRNCGK